MKMRHRKRWRTVYFTYRGFSGFLDLNDKGELTLRERLSTVIWIRKPGKKGFTWDIKYF